MPTITLARQLEKALLDGLEAFVVDDAGVPLIPRSSMRPIRSQRPLPPKPYLLYGFYESWRHPGAMVGFNPPVCVGVELIPENTITAQGTTTSYQTPYRLIDESQDFPTLEVAPTNYVKVGEQTSRVLQLVGTDILVLKDPIITGSDLVYEIRPQKAKVYWWVYGLKGLAITVVADDIFQADLIGDKVRDFFILGTGAAQSFREWGWIIWNAGNIVAAEIEEDKQRLSQHRDLTVVLKGREIRTELVEPIEAPVIELEGAKGEGMPPPIEPELERALIDIEPETVLDP